MVEIQIEIDLPVSHAVDGRYAELLAGAADDRGDIVIKTDQLVEKISEEESAG